MIGTTLSHYTIISKLGQGGMGEVYLAQDTKLDRQVALKLLPAEFTQDADRVRRFMQEAKAASALNHPNIITIHEIGEVDGTHFIATEFINGLTLRQQIAKEKLRLHTALEVASQVAFALTAAHETGIVHRDIKPENVMLRPDGVVKVLDFGLAKLIERRSPTVDENAPTAMPVKTDPGTVMGTVTYMSPEQARGVEVDARTDLFSLGVVLYEMLTGRVPFAGETASHIIVAILEKEPLPLTRAAPGVLAELERIVTKALVKDREERYQSAKDLLIDLKRLRARQELEAELARSAPPETSAGAGQATDGGATAQAIATPPSLPSGEAVARTTSSAEYLISEIKQHQRAALLVSLLLIVSLAGLGYFYFFRGGGAIDSLAIMPFANASGDPNAEYLSDGLTESLIYNLSQLPRLRVLPRSSVFRYKGKEADPQTVSRELGVRAVLAGRVVQRGDDLSISAELIDTRENKVLWGQQYSRKLADALAVQQEISKEISERLRLSLSGEEEKRLTKRPTENGEAYQAYLKGRYYWDKRTNAGIKKGIEYFQQAIDLDPTYALAYTGLADSYAVLPWFSATSTKEVAPKAKAAATRAIELDRNLAEAHTSLAGIIYLFDWDFSRAEKEFQRAIELNPNYANAHRWYSRLLAALGRFDESKREIILAQQLEPLSLLINKNAADTFNDARQYDQAIEQSKKTVEMDPNYPSAHEELATAYKGKVRYEDAVTELNQAIALGGGAPIYVAQLGHVYAVSSKKAEANKILRELIERAKTEYVSAYDIASVYAGLGDKEKAFAWLEKAFQERSLGLVVLKVDAYWDSLRADPRFQDLLRRVGLPQ